MRTQSINRSDAEKMWGIFHNATESTIDDGRPAFLSVETDAEYGNDLYTAAATEARALVGVADEAIAADGYGKVQTYGYKSAVYLNAKGATTATAGDALGLIANATSMNAGFDSGGTKDNYGPVILLETKGLSSETTAKCHIRCM